ncbi:hypothetical protein M569_15682 [Genlisea aurea]|uniref:Uncharacterized protein n=1 Tax=Genlisea aurea TaxID=192259 RepID=S8BXK8_9LAMI|nr:hypothetical protein M569_15682 [Genlisea aurea]
MTCTMAILLLVIFNFSSAHLTADWLFLSLSMATAVEMMDSSEGLLTVGSIFAMG